MSKPDYISNVYNALKDGYSDFDKTPEKFRELMSDSTYVKNVHSALKAAYSDFDKDESQFFEAVGLKKKEPSASKSPSSASSPSSKSALESGKPSAPAPSVKLPSEAVQIALQEETDRGNPFRSVMPEPFMGSPATPVLIGAEDPLETPEESLRRVSNKPAEKPVESGRKVPVFNPSTGLSTWVDAAYVSKDKGGDAKTEQEKAEEYLSSKEYQDHVKFIESMAGPVFSKYEQNLKEFKYPSGQEATEFMKSIASTADDELIAKMKDGKANSHDVRVRDKFRAMYRNKFVDELMQDESIAEQPDHRKYEIRMYLDNRIKNYESEQRIKSEIERGFKARGIKLDEEGFPAVIGEASSLVKEFSNKVDALAAASGSGYQRAQKEINNLTAQAKVELDELFSNLKQAVESSSMTDVEAQTQYDKAYKEKMDNVNRYIKAQNASLESVYRKTYDKYKSEYQAKVAPVIEKAKSQGIDIDLERGLINMDNLYNQVAGAATLKESYRRKISNLKLWSEFGVGERLETAWTTGVGSMVNTMAGAYLASGYYQTGEYLKRKSENAQYDKMPELPEFTAQSLVTPDWWITKGVAMLPFTLALMVPSAGAGFLAGAGATSLGASALTASVVGAATAAAVSRPLESLLEGGGKYLEVIQSGGSVEQAEKEFAYVNSRNYALYLSDFAQYFITMGLAKNLTKMGAAMAGAGIGMPLEGGEEVYQEWINKRAGDLDYGLREFLATPQAKEVFVLGAANGLAFSVLGMASQDDSKKIKDLQDKMLRQVTSVMMMHGEGLVASKKRIEDVFGAQYINGVISRPEYEKALSVLGEVASAVESVGDGAMNTQQLSQLIESMHELSSINSSMSTAKDQAAKDILKARHSEKMTQIKEILNGTASGYFVDDVYYSESDFNSLLNDQRFMEYVASNGVKLTVVNNNDMQAKMELAMQDVSAKFTDKKIAEQRVEKVEPKAPNVTISEVDAQTLQLVEAGQPIERQAGESLINALSTERDRLQQQLDSGDRVNTSEELQAAIDVINEDLFNVSKEFIRQHGEQEGLTDRVSESDIVAEPASITKSEVSVRAESILQSGTSTEEVDKAASEIAKERNRLKRDKAARAEFGNPQVNKEVKRLGELYDKLTKKSEELSKEKPQESEPQKADAAEEEDTVNTDYEAKRKEYRSAKKEYDAAQAKLDNYEKLTEVEQESAIAKMEEASKRLSRVEKALSKASSEASVDDIQFESASDVASVNASKVSVNTETSEVGSVTTFSQETKTRGGNVAIRNYKTYDSPERFARDFGVKPGAAGLIGVGRVNVRSVTIEDGKATVEVEIDGNVALIPMSKKAPVLSEINKASQDADKLKAKEPKRITVKNKQRAAKLAASMFGMNEEQAQFAAGFLDQLARGRARRYGRPVDEFFDGMVFVKRVNGGKGGLMQDTSARFYSPTERALQQIKQERGSVAQFKAMLLKNGAKQAEMDWMGWDERFHDAGKMISKADIQQWIDSNKIEVQEVEKGRYSNRDLDVIKVEPFVFNVVDTKTNEVLLSNVSQDRAWTFVENAHNGTNTKYSQYQTPGGENYKEMLLVMPKDKGLLWKQNKAGLWAYFVGDKQVSDGVPDNTYKEIARKTINSRNVLESQKDDFKSSHFDEPNILAHVRFNERTDADGNKVLFVEEIQSDWAQKGKKEGFKSKEIEDKKLSLQDKVKSIEDKITDNKMSITTDMSDGEYDALRKENIRLMGEKNAIKREIMALDGKNNIPSMPFKKTDQWVKLALRRVMQYAAENGFDRVAWTTGEMQVERYDLSKQVDKLAYQKREGGYFVSAMINGVGNPLNNGNTISENQLEEYVGKEVAQKIVNGEGDVQNYAGNNEPRNEFKELSGTDLKVGGEGMKAFYDGIIPSVASNLGKPFGAKVGEVYLPSIKQYEVAKNTEDIKRFSKSGYSFTWNGNDITKQRAYEIIENGGQVEAVPVQSTQVQSLPVTDAMRKSVMQGVPLFQSISSPKTIIHSEMFDRVQRSLTEEQPLASIQFTDGTTVVSAFEGANITSFIHEIAGHYSFEDILLAIQGKLGNESISARAKQELSDIVDAYNKNVESGALQGQKWTAEDVFTNREAYVAIHEFFADGFVNWLNNAGQSTDSKLVKAFKRFADWLKGMFEGLKGEGLQLTPELEALYRDISNVDYEVAEKSKAPTSVKELTSMLIDDYNVPPIPAKIIAQLSDYAASMAVLTKGYESKEKWYEDNMNLVSKIYSPKFTASPLSSVKSRDFVNKARYIASLIDSEVSADIALTQPYIASVAEAAISGNQSAQALISAMLQAYNAVNNTEYSADQLLESDIQKDFSKFASKLMFSYNDRGEYKPGEMNLITRLIGPGFKSKSFKPEIGYAAVDFRNFLNEVLEMAAGSGVLNSMPKNVLTAFKRANGLKAVSSTTFNKNRSIAQPLYEAFKIEGMIRKGKRTLQQPGWMIMSPFVETDGANQENNYKAFDQYLASLVAEGYLFDRLEDGANGKPSYIIYGVSDKKAMEIGRKFRQETVTTSTGAINSYSGYVAEMSGGPKFNEQITENERENASVFRLSNGEKLSVYLNLQFPAVVHPELATKKGIIRGNVNADEAGRIPVSITDDEVMYYADGEVYPSNEDPFDYAGSATQNMPEAGRAIVFIPGQKGVATASLTELSKLAKTLSGEIKIQEGDYGDFVIIEGFNEKKDSSKKLNTFLAELYKIEPMAKSVAMLNDNISGEQRIQLAEMYARNDGFKAAVITGNNPVINKFQAPHSSVSVTGEVLFQAKRRRGQNVAPAPVVPGAPAPSVPVNPVDLNNALNEAMKQEVDNARENAIADRFFYKFGKLAFSRNFGLEYAVDKTKSAEAEKVKQRINQVRRATAKSSFQIQQAFNRVIGGFKNNLSKPERALLSRYLNMKRVIELDTLADNQGRQRMIHTILDNNGNPLVLNRESAQAWVDAVENGNADILTSFGIKDISNYNHNRLENAASEYWAVMRGQLGKLREQNLISEPAYQKMLAEGMNYSPRLFVDKLQESMDLNLPHTSKTGIHSLHEGSDELLLENFMQSLSYVISNTEQSIAQARLGRAMEAFLAAYQVPWGYQAKYSQEFLDDLNKEMKLRADAAAKGIQREDRFIEPRFEKPMNGFTPIRYISNNGMKKEFHLTNDMANFYSGDPAEYGKASQFADMLGTVMFTKVLKATATGYNPEFLVRNVPLDVLHILLTTNIYGQSVTFGVAKMAFDAVKPRPGGSILRNVIRRNGVVQDYYRTGGYNQTLTHESRFRFLDRFFNSHTRTSITIDNIKKVLAYPGESSELLTRLTLRQKYLDSKLAELAKKGIILTQQERNELEEDATEFAIGYLDFSKGGTFIKEMDKLIPYLNAATQVTYGTLRAARRNPAAFAGKVTELATFSILLGAWNLGLMGKLFKGVFDDDEEASKFETITEERARFYRDNINDRIKAANWIIMTNWNYMDNDGQKRYVYFKIPKDSSIQLAVGGMEDIFHSVMTKDPRYVLSKQRSAELKNLFSLIDVSAMPPLMKAINNYRLNKDTYYNQDIWRRQAVTPEMEYYIGKTPNLYVEVGDALNMSPVRLENAVNQIIVKTNTFYAMMLGATNVVVGDNVLPMNEQQQMWESITNAYFLRRVMGVTDYSKDRQILDDLEIQRNTELLKIDNYIKLLMYGKTGDQTISEINENAKKITEDLFALGTPSFIEPTKVLDYKNAIQKLVKRTINKKLMDDAVKEGRHDYRLIQALYYADVERARYVYQVASELKPEAQKEFVRSVYEIPGFANKGFFAELETLNKRNGTSIGF